MNVLAGGFATHRFAETGLLSFASTHVRVAEAVPPPHDAEHAEGAESVQ
jgi:hypothetical protein